VGAAAVRLAGIYALGVVCLLTSLLLMLEGPRVSPSDTALVVALPFSVLFGFAFVILAVARRAGFGILWRLLLALWTWMMIREGPSPWIPRLFLGWSSLALPLFTIGALGVRHSYSGQSALRWPPASRLMATIWLVLAAAALYVVT
jgi:hypothetical protein